MDLSAPKSDVEDQCNIKSSFSVSRTGLNNELQCIKLIKTKNDGELMIVKTDVQENSSGSVIDNQLFNTKMTEEDNDGVIQSPLKEGSFEKDGIESVVMVVDPTARTLDSNLSDNDIDNDTEVKRKSSDVIEVPTPSNLLLSSQFPPHMLTNHCPSCNKPFFNLFLLQRHIMIHNQEPCFPCDYCDKIFNDRAALKSHWRDHAGLGKLTCMTCGEAFKERSELSEHVVIHDVIKPYHCVVCSRKFSNRSDLRKHLIIHTGARPYVCACGKSFTRSTNLNKHARAHAGERPFNCPSCTKTFSTKADLTRHSVTHTGEKPYSCTICGLAFSRRDKLTRHIKLHEKNRPFHCEQCALSFNNRKVLAAHYQIHHAGVSLPTEISSATESSNKTNSTNQQNVKKNNTNNKSSRKLLFPKKISKIPVQVEVKEDDETSEDVVINVDPFHINNDSVDQEIIYDNGNL